MPSRNDDDTGATWRRRPPYVKKLDSLSKGAHQGEEHWGQIHRTTTLTWEKFGTHGGAKTGGSISNKKSDHIGIRARLLNSVWGREVRGQKRGKAYMDWKIVKKFSDQMNTNDNDQGGPILAEKALLTRVSKMGDG